MKYSEIEKVILNLPPLSLYLFKKYGYNEWLERNNTMLNKEQYNRYLKDLEEVYKLENLSFNGKTKEKEMWRNFKKLSKSF